MGSYEEKILAALLKLNPFNDIDDLILGQLIEDFFRENEIVKKNINIRMGFGNIFGRNSFGDDRDLLLGYQKIEEGVEFYGFMACDDDEIPVYIILYLENDVLNLYIPIDGNMIDADNMSAFIDEGFEKEIIYDRNKINKEITNQIKK